MAFLLTLALRLGKTLQEICNQISAEELFLWQAYDRESPLVINGLMCWLPLAQPLHFKLKAQRLRQWICCPHGDFNRCVLMTRKRGKKYLGSICQTGLTYSLEGEC